MFQRLWILARWILFGTPIPAPIPNRSNAVDQELAAWIRDRRRLDNLRQDLAAK
ncbi:MAG: hypothetical protein Q8R28_19285 [Dehalococcoidia bacterium]|nr:hypothetical protein [Dehalococcoidia bacterium]